jgi:autoinducer 2-degrading protein
MFVVCVTVWVKAGHEQDFVKATEANHRATRQEPGNCRFDVLQSRDEAGRFFLYEVYRDAEGFAAHQKTPHYLAWRETVAPWMAQPRQGVKHQSLLPDDEGF